MVYLGKSDLFYVIINFYFILIIWCYFVGLFLVFVIFVRKVKKFFSVCSNFMVENRDVVCMVCECFVCEIGVF